MTKHPEQEKMSAENLRVATEFITNWRNQSPPRVKAELLSFSNETHRETDSYFFEFINGELIDPETSQPIKDFIERESRLGKIEYEILETLEGWIQTNEEGTAIWISPPYPGKYPCSKIITHQIAYQLTPNGMKKALLNSAYLFEAPVEDITTFASELGQLPYPYIETVRRYLFTHKNDNKVLSKVINFVTQYQLSEENSNINPEQAHVFANMIAQGLPADDIARLMQQRGFLGEHPISCPPGAPTFSEFLTSHLTHPEGKKTFYCTCPNCNKKVNAEIYDGEIHCPNCGSSAPYKC